MGEDPKNIDLSTSSKGMKKKEKLKNKSLGYGKIVTAYFSYKRRKGGVEREGIKVNQHL